MSDETITAPITAGIIVIGNEVLSGRTRDANVQMLGKGLGDLGIRVREVRVVPDDEDMIVTAVNEVRARYDYVFTTGGIGPTHDDITSACIAKAFGVRLELNAEAERRLRHHYGDGELNTARLRMAHAPEGAVLIDNPVSQAPGYRIGNVHVLAGVPRIAEAMFDGIKLGLKGGARVLSRSVAGYVREGDMAEELGAIQARFPTVDIGSYPFVRSDRLGTSVVARGTDAASIDAAILEVSTAMRRLGVEPEVEDPMGNGIAAL
jgi:molybdenum cofactor synthesis domain-containing protein